MDSIFDRMCSVYTDAKDNVGRFVDMETGEIIQSMTIREFCMTDRWQPVVEKLRGMVETMGEKAAKASDEYRETKQFLPGATLSGLFEPREVEVEKTNRRTGEKFIVKEMVSRRGSHLAQHTGFLCIDIDHQDNESLGDMKSILRTLRHRPEVALLMKSCSGTGYFALIPLLYPQYHKEQFKALLREYSALGIQIDRKCGDVTRIRFASYDSDPYINEHALAYAGVCLETSEQVLAPKAAVYSSSGESDDQLVERVRRMVELLERTNTDIVNDYDVWFRVGLSLANLPAPYGFEFFDRVSRINVSKYNAKDVEEKFKYNSSPDKISIAYFFARCKDAGITLRGF